MCPFLNFKRLIFIFELLIPEGRVTTLDQDRSFDRGQGQTMGMNKYKLFNP